MPKKMNQKEVEDLKKEQEIHDLQESHQEDILNHDKKYKRLDDKFRSLNRRYNTLLRENQEISRAADFRDKVEPSSIICEPLTESKKKSKGSEGVAVMVMSDVHAFEFVKAESVNGVNEYNPDIARDSIRNFFIRGLKLVKVHRNGTAINTLILALLGDLMNGFLRDEDLAANAGTPFEEVRFLLEELKSGIDYLLEKGEFKKIIIPCSGGNHGRTTQKIWSEKNTEMSYEIHMYQMLASMFSGNKKVEFAISEGYHTYVDVYGYSIRFHHGDAIRYGGGIGGLTIPANKAINNWNYANHASLDVFGHFHTFFWGKTFISNGSVVGANAFALRIKAPFEKPSQSFFVIDKKRFITAVSPIFVRNEH